MSTKRLPPIFKMSVLCNILPYYGHLHRWRRLLEKINTETKEIWDQNREQLKYIGRDFKRDIGVDSFKINICKLRPNRSWIDLLFLSLSYNFNIYDFDLLNLVKNISKDEVIIFDSHDDIFNGYQIHYCSKDRVSDILPAIKCPSFKSETKIFKPSETYEICRLIFNQNHTKSVVIENANNKLSINLVYGNTIKIAPSTFDYFLQSEFFDKLQERYKLCEIEDCACKPKKIRAQFNDFKNFKIVTGQLKCISSINDAKLGVYIVFKIFYRNFSKYDTIVFNHSSSIMSVRDTNLMFSGDTLAVVYKGDLYNFRLDQRKKKSEDSYIKGNIIKKNKSKNYFALDVDKIYNLRLIHTDEEEKNSKDKDFIEDLKELSAQEGGCYIVFDKKDITLKIAIDEVKIKMPEQEFYSKVDVGINDRINSEDIICKLEHIPNHLTIRIEADYIKQIIELMKSKTLIEKLKEQRIRFLYNSIEIEPRIIESKMDENDLNNEVKEIKAKRCRMNMDCDK